MEFSSLNDFNHCCLFSILVKGYAIFVYACTNHSIFFPFLYNDLVRTNYLMFSGIIVTSGWIEFATNRSYLLHSYWHSIFKNHNKQVLCNFSVQMTLVLQFHNSTFFRISSILVYTVNKDLSSSNKNSVIIRLWSKLNEYYYSYHKIFINHDISKMSLRKILANKIHNVNFFDKTKFYSLVINCSLLLIKKQYANVSFLWFCHTVFFFVTHEWEHRSY